MKICVHRRLAPPFFLVFFRGLKIGITVIAPCKAMAIQTENLKGGGCRRRRGTARDGHLALPFLLLATPCLREVMLSSVVATTAEALRKIFVAFPSTRPFLYRHDLRPTRDRVTNDHD